ncbi:hypothetical protein CLV32_0823 [Pedobacter duraquae]|uniref:Uncharacterized protein n=1 Tax=Pedobacter duraquae TaxID=425511 RepID=A0A4R6IQB6_9SPHI|nr:hypothetical protein CLV32_0823 [Pedobacter duraquae]
MFNLLVSTNWLGFEAVPGPTGTAFFYGLLHEVPPST